jgi:hypothetical protein
MAPFADNRFDCSGLLQRIVIHYRTGKASCICLWYSSQKDLLQAISSKRQTIFFGADPQFSCCERQGAASGLQEWQIYRAGYQAIELPLKG